MKIGVFDSGAGGKSVVKAIEKSLPAHEVIYAHDRKNVPYGLKSPEILLELISPILQRMIDQGCEVIVIACNTVTTTIIDDLRMNFKVPFIGIEPMVKPAAERSKSKIIAVCATPTTLSSKRYRQLIEDHAKHLTILEPDCSDWSYMIEQNQVNHVHIRKLITEVCRRGADVIVLGCTHYHWIEDDIRKIADDYRAIVIQPEQAVVAQLKRVIEQLG